MKEIEKLVSTLNALSKDLVGNYCMGAYDRAAGYADAMAKMAAVASTMLEALHDIDKNEAKLVTGGLPREQRDSIKKALWWARKKLAQAEGRVNEINAIAYKASEPIRTMDVERIERYMKAAPRRLHDIITHSGDSIEKLQAAGANITVVNLSDSKDNRPAGMELN